MGSLRRIVLLMLKLFVAPILLLLFSYYTLMIFMKMLSVMLLFVLVVTFLLLMWSSFWLEERLELASELESDLRDSAKTRLALFGRFNNSCYWCEIGSVYLWWKIIFWDAAIVSHVNWIGTLASFFLLKLPLRKLKSWLFLWYFFHLRLRFMAVSLPTDVSWNTFVMSCTSNYYVHTGQLLKNEPSKICARQPLKNLKGYGLLKQ